MNRTKFVVVAAVLVLTAALAQGQGCEGLTCSGGQCTLTGFAPQSGPPLFRGLAVYLTNSSNANCSPTYAFDGNVGTTGRFTVVLMGTATGGPPNSCSWRLRPLGTNADTFCSFDDGDGLPVELLEFEVEETTIGPVEEAAAAGAMADDEH